MAKTKNKGMRAPKGRLKKLNKKQYQQVEQEDALRGFEVVVDAVGAGGFGTELLQKLNKQRKEISEGQDHTANALDGMKGLKGRKPISYHFKYQPTEEDATNSPMRLRANIKNVYIVLSAAELSRAASASTGAIKAIEQENIEESFNHYIRAERSLAAALAFNRVERATSWIAKAKAKARHTEHHALRAKAIKIWRAEVGPKPSAPKAADEILGRIQWAAGEFVAHHTLVEWITAEKKKALRATKR